MTLWCTSPAPASSGDPCIMQERQAAGGTREWSLHIEGPDNYMPDPNKPPYQVPPMTEVAKVRGTNGFTAVSTFSGAGGSCLGHEMAGFHLAWASEFIPAAQEVFRLNHPDAILDTRDIRNVKGSEILDAIGMEICELDLLDGSPPCSSFSTAGKREKGWGEVKKYSDSAQRTDDLFYEYARLVEELKPKVFVAENVSGLVKGTAKGYFQLIMRELKSKGYRVKAKVLDAKWLGVPQSRQRLIFMGVREDLGLDPVYPKPLSYFYSVRDALPWIGRAVHDTSGIMSSGEYTNTPCPAITVSGGAAHHHHKIYDERRPIAPRSLRPGWNSAKEIHPDHPAHTITIAANGNDAIVYGPTEGEATMLVQGFTAGQRGMDRLSERSIDNPSPTILASDGARPITHANPILVSAPTQEEPEEPNEPRKFTISELKRICAFPDDFQLTGSYSQQWERLGRAVPPLMMRAVAEVVRDEILAKVKS